MSEEKLPVCGCAQSHMYKVAYVLPLISELFIRVCGCVCVRACVCEIASKRNKLGLHLLKWENVIFETRA